MKFDWKWSLADLPKDPTRGTVFSTFACGGGSSMGYKRAGFKVLGCCEIDPKINAIYKRNLHPKHSFVMDLRDFNKLENLPEELYSLDILDGSPPCSTFSMAGSREDAWGKEKKFAEGQKKQTLDDLFFVFLETVEKLKPKVVVAENVKGLVVGNARGYVNEIIKRFRELGYGAFMNVPQRRERVFFVANRMGYPKLRLDPKEKPIPFGAVKSAEGKPIAKGDSLASTGHLLAKAKPGDKNLADINLRMRGKNIGFTIPLVWDGDIAPTLTATMTPVRMPDATYFSPEDMRNISTFPQDYDFSEGGKVKSERVNFMCGMSVPPNMVAHIADAIGTQWFKRKA